MSMMSCSWIDIYICRIHVYKCVSVFVYVQYLSIAPFENYSVMCIYMLFFVNIWM